VPAKEMEILLLEYVKSEHRGEYETLTTTVSETKSIEVTEKSKGLHYLEVCELRSIGPKETKKPENNAMFEEFVEIGLYSRTCLDTSVIAKLEKNGYPECANFKYFATQSTHANIKKKEEGTSYSHSQKMSEMSTEKRTEKRKDMLTLFSKKKVTELVGVKQDRKTKQTAFTGRPIPIVIDAVTACPNLLCTDPRLCLHCRGLCQDPLHSTTASRPRVGGQRFP
jgi:hypothetical protein